jgi:hypothetical protein
VVLALEIWPENMAALGAAGISCVCRLIPAIDLMHRRAASWKSSTGGGNLPEPAGAAAMCAQAALSRAGGRQRCGGELCLAEALRQKPDESQVVELVAAAYTRLMPAGMRAVTLLQSFIERLRQAVKSSVAAGRTIARCELLLAGLYSEVLLQPESAVRTAAPVPGERRARSDSASAGADRAAGSLHALAQELFRLGRYLEARTEIDALLLSVQPKACQAFRLRCSVAIRTIRAEFWSHSAI